MSIADYGFAIWETFYVTVLSTAFALVLGLPLGVLLVAGDKDGVLPLPGWLMHTLNIIINILRSVPFLILIPHKFYPRIPRENNVRASHRTHRAAHRKRLHLTKLPARCPRVHR